MLSLFKTYIYTKSKGFSIDIFISNFLWAIDNHNDINLWQDDNVTPEGLS